MKNLTRLEMSLRLLIQVRFAHNLPALSDEMVNACADRYDELMAAMCGLAEDPDLASEGEQLLQALAGPALGQAFVWLHGPRFRHWNAVNICLLPQQSAEDRSAGPPETAEDDQASCPPEAAGVDQAECPPQAAGEAQANCPPLAADENP